MDYDQTQDAIRTLLKSLLEKRDFPEGMALARQIDIILFINVPISWLGLFGQPESTEDSLKT